MMPVQAPSVASADAPVTPAELATIVHDDVLQSLGVAVLGVDLCRRLHRRTRYEQALDELDGIVEALQAAQASTWRIVPDLKLLSPRASAATTRPGLVVLVGAPGLPATVPVRAGPGPVEIAETLAACEIQARRCRHQYDAGLGEDTMRDLELLLQRLQFVAIAFRAVLNQLREQPGAGAVPDAWARTA